MASQRQMMLIVSMAFAKAHTQPDNRQNSFNSSISMSPYFVEVQKDIEAYPVGSLYNHQRV